MEAPVLVQSSIVSEMPPGRAQIIGASLVMLTALVACAAALPYGQTQFAPEMGSLPALGSITAFADLFTAVLLVGQASATQSRAAMHLAAAYLFSFLVVVPHLLSFPGLFTGGFIIGGNGTATWLWCVWHAGFAVLVGSFAVVAKNDRPAGHGSIAVLAIAVICAGLSIWVATCGLPHLPTLLVGENYQRITALGIGPGVLGCNLAALVLVVVRLRARSTVALWLAVAMLAACLDVTLALSGSGRFTFGWYLGRALSLLGNITVFTALLFESMRLFTRVSEANRHLEHLSLTDVLTQLPNRRAFETSFAVEWRRAEREMLPVSLLMVDVDQFKGFNDRFGHPAGDRCLTLVAQTLSAIVRRPLDMAARLGGEEFVLLLPNTEAEGAAWMGERVRGAIQALQISNPESHHGIVTVSVGVATSFPRMPGSKPLDVIERADGALYEAKRAGRNHVHAEGPGAASGYPIDAMAWCAADRVAQDA